MKPLALIATFVILLTQFSDASAQKPYTIDPVHSTIIFKSLHVGAGYTYGRFRKISGSFVINERNPPRSKVSIEVDAASIYTADKKRDTHLKGPDFLNTKQYPKITFTSTRVQKTRGGASITGKLKLHGVTRTITVKMRFVGKGKDPWGNHRAGFEGTFSIKLADYKIKGMAGAVGEKIDLIVAIEGMRK